ncbi:hypothetical protein ACO229_14145 [Promicromonospora sp. MS192]|uniref:hypothetical protein n=1 Tax=Promicromonospora sp. MS192 TaxID=3412684 RepID=UPI003C2D38E7
MSDGMPDLASDPEGFLLWLRRGAAEGRLLASARPSLEDVAVALLTLEDSLTEALWGGRETARFDEHPLRPMPGARGAIAGTRNLNPQGQLTLEVADGYITAVRDHLNGLALLAGVDGPRRSVLALARTLFEASVHAAYLLEPELDDRERTLRSYNFLMEGVRQEIADGGDASELVEQQARLRRAAAADKFIFATKRNGNGNLVDDPNTIAPRVSAASVRAHVLGKDAEHAWRGLSSVTHGQERTDLQFILGLAPMGAGPHADSYATLWLVMAVEGAIHAALYAQEFYGTVGEPISDLGIALVRRTLQLASGLADGEIREQLSSEHAPPAS